MLEPEDFELYAVSLIVVGGARTGEEYAVERSPWVVGRGPDADVVLDDPELSSRHIAITLTGGRFQVSDLGSGTGTRVNGETISVGELRHGDRIAIGTQILQILIERKDAVPLYSSGVRAPGAEDPAATA